MATLFISDYVCEDGLETLKSSGIDYEMWNRNRQGQLDLETYFQKIKGAKAILSHLGDKIDAAFLQKTSGIKVIANYAVGHNNIDSKKAKELGIVVTNTPDVLTEATAEGALALMMATVRNYRASQHFIDNGEWTRFNSMLLPGRELKGLTLGVVGLGRIGARLAQMCERAFDMKILYHTRSGKSPLAEKSYEAATLDELLQRSDIVVALCPLNDDSRFMFNKETFGKMKKNAFFINVARGEVHQEQDLIHALSTGVIAGAGLDVYSPEPISMDSKLLKLKNVYLTPHFASGTIEARAAMTKLCVANIISVLGGKAPLTAVNL